MATFIELCFHAVGETAHRATIDEIKLISGVELLLDHTRELSWLERERLWVEEWDCRIVVWVHETAELYEPDRHVSTERDPYRTLEFGGPVRRVPTALGELMETIGASHALVDKGWLRFETRRYEAELTEALRGELADIAGRHVAARFAVLPGGKLSGRMEGSIPVIRLLQRHLLRSGMVALERVTVGYS